MTQQLTVAHALSEAGKRRLLETLAATLSNKQLNTMLEAWLGDVKFAEHDPLEARIEIGSYYTKDKCPVVLTFRGEEVLTEDVDIEE